MKFSFFTVLLAVTANFSGLAQGTETKLRTLPSIDVKDLDGKNVSTSSFKNDGKPMIVDFWATWCKPCVKELNAIHENYKEWQEKTGVKLIAVSVDDARSMAKVKPFINGQ